MQSVHRGRQRWSRLKSGLVAKVQCKQEGVKRCSQTLLPRRVNRRRCPSVARIRLRQTGHRCLQRPS